MDFTQYPSTNQIPPQLARFFRIDFNFGLFEPIQYISDFWCLMRDMILLDEPKMNRIMQVQKEGISERDPADKRDEFEIKRDNFGGTVRFTYSNQYLNNFLYHEMFRQSQRQNQEWGL